MAIEILIGRSTLKAKKSAIVYGDVYKSHALASILPYFKG